MAMSVFLKRVLETEEYSSNKTFTKQYSYKDRYSDNPTVITCSNSDFSFQGAVQSLRLKYKSKVDHSTGFAVIKTTGKKPDRSNNVYSKYPSSDKPHEYIAILDLDTFMNFFETPTELAEVLMMKGRQIQASWMARNGGEDKTGKRRPLGVTYKLKSYEWRTSKNRDEASTYTLQLSTWGFTAAHQQDADPRLELTDIKVLIKLKSTTNNQGPDTSATDGGQLYDGFGYGTSLPNFVGLLRDEGLSAYLQEVREIVRAGEEEEEESRGENPVAEKRSKASETSWIVPPE